ncbi:MAG: hypothetical protein Q4A01_01660 [Coriobacteriales bacterium]|nr:hypothetical protein [Coriobacteriales bacterium]
MTTEENDAITQVPYDLLNLPAVPEDTLDLSHAVKVPISEISALGAAFASLPAAFRTVNTTTSISIAGDNLCRLFDARGNPLSFTSLQRFKNEAARLGSTFANGSFEQARHLAAGGVAETISSTTVAPYDPTMLFLAIALMQVNQKLDSIASMQEKMFTYAKERDRAKLVAGFKILDEIKQNYRFNGENDQWLSTRHTLVVNAWKDAETAIELCRKQLDAMLDVLGPMHISKDVMRKTSDMAETLRDYQLASYLYSYATVVDVVLAKSFDRDYLESISSKMERYSNDYLILYNHCADVIERDARGTIASQVLHGLGTMGDGLSKFIASTPVGDATPIDEALEDGSKTLRSMSGEGARQSVKALAQAKPGFMRPFIDTIGELNRLHNEPVLVAIGEENVYILPE